MVYTVGMVFGAMQRTGKRSDKSRKKDKTLDNYVHNLIYVMCSYAYCIDLCVEVDVLNKKAETELIDELISIVGKQQKKKTVGYFYKKYKISVDDVLAYYTQAYRIKQKRSKVND